MERIRVVEVQTKTQEKEFIKLLWKVYKDDPNWVPPLISDAKKTVRGENNTYKKVGPSILLLAYKDDEVCGRLCVGINEHLNHAKNYKEGYLSLFECIDNEEVARALFDYAYNWLKEKGMERIIGPLSLPEGDDCRGLLIDNFNDPPIVMNVYNPPYYIKFFEKFGFYKYWDCYAYHYDITKGFDERYDKVCEFAKQKYGFKVEPINLKNIEKEMKDIKQILDKAMPEEWEDFIPPTDEEIELMAKNLVPVADPDLIQIARTNDGTPIGFDIALPDYNQALKHLNGRLLPFGFLKFLYHKRKINRLRLFVLFVVPEYRKKGVPGAIYYEVFKTSIKRGYISGEGSTIWEYNETMRRDVEKAGAKIYKTYRIFKKNIV